jgi:hypothetical protein
MMEMSDRWDCDGDRPVTDDRRTEIAECAAFADLMTKIVAVGEHPEFQKLREHLELVVGREPFVQHYFTKREDQHANKVFELYMATLALLAGGQSRWTRRGGPGETTRKSSRSSTAGVGGWHARSCTRTTRAATEITS